MRNRLSKIKIGLIGCGKVAKNHHLPSLKLVQSIEVGAVADVDKDKLNSLADEFSITKRYLEADDLIKDPEIEAVGILTPTTCHAELGVAALKAGKHVFLEKPLTLSRKECDKLIDLGRSSGKATMTCFNLRWHKHVLRAKKYITSGRLGKVKAIQSTYTHNRDGSKAPDWHRFLNKGGGVTFNESVHHFDLWRFLLDQDIESVCAFQRPSEYYEDETSVISARLAGGALATLAASLESSPTCEVEIIGSQGRLRISLYRFDGFTFYPYTSYPGSLFNRMSDGLSIIPQFIDYLSAIRRGGIFKEIFYYAWLHFADSIIAGNQPSCSFTDGSQAVLTALAAIQSFSQNKVISVDMDNHLPK